MICFLKKIFICLLDQLASQVDLNLFAHLQKIGVITHQSLNHNNYQKNMLRFVNDIASRCQSLHGRANWYTSLHICFWHKTVGHMQYCVLDILICIIFIQFYIILFLKNVIPTLIYLFLVPVRLKQIPCV